MARCTRWIVLALFAAAPCAAQTPPSTTSQPTTGTNPAMAAAAVTSTGPDYPRGRISGYMFGDFYYNVTGNPNHVYDASGNDAGKAYIDATNVPITQDLNGVNLRRVYFQLDNDLSAKYSTRFRLEMDGKSLTSDGKMAVAVKNAYIQGKSIVPRGDGYFGILTTPTFEYAEEFWGYRSLEKTIADFQGIASSADLGLQMKGFADPQHHVGYNAMIGNGVGQKPETNRYKRFYFSMPSRFGDLRVEPYVDYEPLHTNLNGNFDKTTYKIFAGYEFKKMAIGAEGLSYVKRQGAAKTQKPGGISVYARGTMTPTLAWVGRYDRWYADQYNGNRIDNALYIAGIDWQPFRDVHLMPNVEGKQYIAHGNPVGVPPYHELQARLTFYYKFSRPQS
jgi:hypothetical protein